MNSEPISESLPFPMSASLQFVAPRVTHQTNNLGIPSRKLWEMVLQAVPSEQSKRNYAKALDEVFTLCADRSQGIPDPC